MKIGHYYNDDDDDDEWPDLVAMKMEQTNDELPNEGYQVKKIA